MQFDSTRPIWLQVMRELEISIVTGERGPGEKLPGGRDLALAYTINPNTAARVYQILEQEQVSFTRRGLGTFVTEDPERIRLLRSEMAEQLLDQFLNGIERLGITKEEAIDMIKEKEG